MPNSVVILVAVSYLRRKHANYRRHVPWMLSEPPLGGDHGDRIRLGDRYRRGDRSRKAVVAPLTITEAAIRSPHLRLQDDLSHMRKLDDHFCDGLRNKGLQLVGSEYLRQEGLVLPNEQGNKVRVRRTLCATAAIR